jgi:hypothetical protein
MRMHLLFLVLLILLVEIQASRTSNQKHWARDPGFLRGPRADWLHIYFFRRGGQQWFSKHSAHPISFFSLYNSVEVLTKYKINLYTNY